MRAQGTGRQGVAATLIILTAAGLAVALIIAGLSAAAEITSFIFLIPLAVALVRWARQDDAGRSLKNDNTFAKSPGFGGHATGSPVGRNRFPSIPAITFRPPIPWGSLEGVFLATLAAVVGVWCLAYPGRPTKIFGTILLILGVIALIEIVTGGFGSDARAIFDARPKLVVSQEGIYYRWKSTRDVACSWISIIEISRGERDGRINENASWAGEYLVQPVDRKAVARSSCVFLTTLASLGMRYVPRSPVTRRRSMYISKALSLSAGHPVP
jgi:hypothetical protein